MVEKRRLLEFRMPMTGELLSFRNKEYYVTIAGQVWSDNLKRYLKQFERADKYMSVNLKSDEGEWHPILVHNLAASCFIRLLEKGENVHHIDKNPKNNNLSNLEIIDGGEHARQHAMEKWASGTMNGVAAKASEKMKKAWARGAFEGHGEKVAAKLRNVGTSRPARQVAQLSLDGKLVKVWPSTQECHRNGFYQGAISHCCRNSFNRPGNNVYKGFKWMWLEDFNASQHDNAQVETQPVQLEFNFQ